MATETLAPDCVRVDIACNNPESGRFSGYARALQIGKGGALIELEARGRGIAIGITGGRLRIGRQVFDLHGQAHWIGSMAWDGLWMTVQEAARLLLWVHDHKWFTMIGAETGIFDMWQRHESFAGAHLIEQLTRVGMTQAGRS